MISYNYSPELTGIGKYNTEFCEYLVNKGHTIEVITGFPNYPHWKLYDGFKNIFYISDYINGVRLTRCPLFIPINPSGTKRMIMDLSFFISSLLIVIKKLISFDKYDLVFIPSPSFLTGLHLMYLPFFWRKTKFVYHIQDLQIDAAMELGIIKFGWIRGFLLYMEKLILEKASMISTISEGMRKKILSKKALNKNIYMMPNWVDEKAIFSTNVNLDIISKLGIPIEKKVFLYSGAIGEKQDLESLLKVANTLIKKCPDLLFVISGSGPYKKQLEKIVSNLHISNVQFIDIQPITIFNQLLNFTTCHLIIQKKQASESFLPSKLGSILAVGGLLLVTAEKGTTLYEITHKNQLGFVIEPENETVLYECILQIYNQLQNSPYLNSFSEFKINAKVYSNKFLRKDTIIDYFINNINNL